jgi:hypothetical protein
MGAIARNIANNITTSGVFTSGAITNSSVTGITVLANASDGITFISSQTASDSASISFTTGLTSTYKAYKFVFSSIKPASSANLSFNFSTDSGSNYNVTKTSAQFRTLHNESDSTTALSFFNGLAQSTAFQQFGNAGSASDKTTSGSLLLFNPSSTTYVKHYIATLNDLTDDDFSEGIYSAGYGNTTSAINAIQFKMTTGNMTAGTIYMYGIK